jgi:hypothetical protein
MSRSLRGLRSSGTSLVSERTKPMEEARDAASSRSCVAADSSMEQGLAVEPTPPPRSDSGSHFRVDWATGFRLSGVERSCRGST